MQRQVIVKFSSFDFVMISAVYYYCYLYLLFFSWEYQWSVYNRRSRRKDEWKWYIIIAIILWNFICMHKSLWYWFWWRTEQHHYLQMVRTVLIPFFIFNHCNSTKPGEDSLITESSYENALPSSFRIDPMPCIHLPQVNNPSLVIYRVM